MKIELENASIERYKCVYILTQVYIYIYLVIFLEKAFPTKRINTSSSTSLSKFVLLNKEMQ